MVLQATKRKFMALAAFSFEIFILLTQIWQTLVSSASSRGETALGLRRGWGSEQMIKTDADVAHKLLQQKQFE